MKVFTPNLLLCALLVASGCSERTPSSNAGGGKAILVNDASANSVDPAANGSGQMDEMRRRVDRLANMTGAERDYMMQHPEALRETENQACAPGNPC